MLKFNLTTFISKRAAELYHEPNGRDSRILISLTTPAGYASHARSIGCSPAKLHDDTWKDVLRIEFHDADPGHMNDNEVLGYKLFTDEDAINILRFLKLYEESGCDVIVHCEAGISRSAGVSKFIAQVYNLRFPENYSVYNKHVFSTLLRVYGQCLYGEGTLTLDELPGITP